MFQGTLEAIFITPTARGELQRVDQVEAVVGKGLVGDRYGERQGTFFKPDSPDREVTLIEIEALEGLEREYQMHLPPSQSRRNLLTRAVPLNHLVGRDFRVGTVVLRGLRLCEPCQHLEKLTELSVRKGLIHRGGLRAQVIQGGILRCGDSIQLASAASTNGSPAG